MVAPPDTVKKAKPIEVEIDEETIPDSLLHPRWKVQRTTPITYDDLKENSTDLIRPENMRQTVEYNDSLDRYIIGYKIGKTYVMAPIMMTPEEYRKWTEKRSFTDYYRSKNQEILREKGKDKFDFTDMHFSLGPAEKIFGPGGVRIKTQGSAELKFGANIKNIDNPSLPIRNRKTTAMDFDEKINVNVNGVSCLPPRELTLLLELFFCDNTVCNFSLPNCISVRIPKRADAPCTSELLEGKDTLPPSTSLIISSSFPSYLSLKFCVSKSKVASVL